VGLSMILLRACGEYCPVKQKCMVMSSLFATKCAQTREAKSPPWARGRL
jgi:hypothetical protein